SRSRPRHWPTCAARSPHSRSAPPSGSSVTTSMPRPRPSSSTTTSTRSGPGTDEPPRTDPRREAVMADDRATTAYAEALFTVTLIEGNPERITDELFRVARALEGSDELAKTLGDPQVP